VALTISFPKSNDRRRVAVFEWDGGLVATTPAGQNPDRLPHDLTHYVVEAYFRPPYGFWSLASQKAPFTSLTVVKGRWPGGRKEWLARVIRKHGAEMLQAEAKALGALTDPAVDFEATWPLVARGFKRGYDFGPANPFRSVTRADLLALRQQHFDLTHAWHRVPMGGALVVHWPPDVPPSIVAQSANHEPGSASNRLARR
jgi:hypothetical protein